VDVREIRRLMLDSGTLHILPVIRGLESEVGVVQDAFEETDPDAVAVSISKEELAGLRDLRGDEEFELSSMEIVYADRLSNFGVVRMPPPCFLAALQLCLEHKIPIVPVDMNEEVYTDTYCEVVGTLDILKESMMAKRIGRTAFAMETPEEFIIDWDRRVNRSRGFRELQLRREAHMAEVLESVSRKRGSLMAVIEMERVEGVVDALRKSIGCV